MDFVNFSPKSMHMAGEQIIMSGLFGDGLDPTNRWLKLSQLIPWNVIEERYGKLFARNRAGPRPISARVAFGSLIVQQRLSLTDVETVSFIQENPYVQAFLGYSAFSAERPFDPSSLTHFRKRFKLDDLQDINELIVSQHRVEPVSAAAADEDEDDDDDSPMPPSHPVDSSSQTLDTDEDVSGTLMMDATCVPADVSYPTDLNLLNHARFITERLIDALHKPFIGINRKPRTYRKVARWQYLRTAKLKKVTKKKATKACRQQLRFLRRNLKIIETQCANGNWKLTSLPKGWYRKLLVVSEAVRQQRLLHNDNARTVADRIVSIEQPHVRPMVRGKASAPYEFGAKIAVAHDGGFAFLEGISWDAYHEAQDLKEHAERYYARHGCYPERILADKIYRTRDNRTWCKGKGIRLAGLGPGRPIADVQKRKAIEREAKRDEADRQPMEGVFGRCKRRFGLKRLLTRLPQTSANAIAILMIVLNLETIISALLKWMVTTKNLHQVDFILFRLLRPRRVCG